jgi:hypothetical protein
MTTPDLSLQNFLFNVPLYRWVKFDEAKEMFASLIAVDFKIDGHCHWCKRETTYTRSSSVMLTTREAEYLQKVTGQKSLAMMCSRHDHHQVHFYLLFARGAVQKIGQWPSLADIANDESKAYIRILDSADAQELHKAIGLAAHGVGVGSYVYLRRVLERLLWKCFQDNLEAHRGSVEDFAALRVTERIGFLKEFLPEFLVENRNVYGFLSKGLHELAEEECLKEFDILKMAIVIILDDAAEKAKRAKLRDHLSAAIQKLGQMPAADDAARG